MKRTYRRYRKPIMFAAAVFGLTTLLVLWGNTALQRTEILVTSPKLPTAFDQIRIAHLSDLHDAMFGADNQRLIQLLEEGKPNIIVLTGDLVDAFRTDVKASLRVVEQAVQIAPCYYVTGNHEAAAKEFNQLEQGLLELGVTVLRNKSMILEQGGEKLRLVGVDDPSFKGSIKNQGRIAAIMNHQLEALREKDELFTLLLSHRPDLFELYASYGADLVLCGHAHGGQIRVPLLGGLYAPSQGILPKYDAGLYQKGETQMVVSRGLGNSRFPVRVNNRPEVIFVTLRAES